tara:strand:+ start:74 stop:349 length:276 start_codon:yes stop_codon:yes gene_type:complete
MRGYSILELLVVVAAAGALISMMFYFRWDDTEKELTEQRNLNQATKMLWMKRIDDPMPERGLWEWQDESGDTWVMFRNGTEVHNMGDIDLP